MSCDRRDGDGDGSDGHCYRIEAVIHLKDVMAMAMDIAIGYEAVMHVIDLIAMVMDIVIGLKL